MIFLRSWTPEVTAEKCTQAAPADLARINASVVLPLPGGPHKIKECSRPAPVMPVKSFPGPSKCSWPMDSSRGLGPIRSPGGGAARGGGGGDEPKRSMETCYHDDIS